MAKTQENTNGSTEEVSFEQALKDLESIVRKLESGSGDLEGSINDYVRGTELKEFCLKKLANARLKVESIMKPEAGKDKISLQPFDAE